MQTKILTATSEHAYETALQLLHQGEIIAFPTDTVYGLAADAFNHQAIQKLFEAKGRDFNKAIAVLIGEETQAQLLAESVSSSALILMRKFWPGGLTVIVPKKAGLPPSLSPADTIGLRIPDQSVAIELLRRFGPLATTSANLSGGKNPITTADVLLQLDQRIPLILDGGACRGGIPSTVVDCTVEPVRILRPGVIHEDQILEALSASQA